MTGIRRVWSLRQRVGEGERERREGQRRERERSGGGKESETRVMGGGEVWVVRREQVFGSELCLVLRGADVRGK